MSAFYVATGLICFTLAGFSLHRGKPFLTTLLVLGGVSLMMATAIKDIRNPRLEAERVKATQQIETRYDVDVLNLSVTSLTVSYVSKDNWRCTTDLVYSGGQYTLADDRDCFPLPR